MLNKTLASLALACACILPASNIAFSAPYNNESAHKLPLADETLTVIFSIAPPFVELQSSLTEPQGLEVELVKELQRRTGFKIRYEKMEVMNFSEMISLGAKGQADIMAASISITPSRAKLFEPTPAYTVSSTSIVARNDGSIKNTNDLKNKVIAVPNGTNLDGLLKQIPGSRALNVSSVFMAFYAVSRGQADAMFIDTPIALSYVENWSNGNLKIVDRLNNSTSDVGLLFKKNSPHNKYLQEAFEEMMLDGTVFDLTEKYLSTTEVN